MLETRASVYWTLMNKNTSPTQGKTCKRWGSKDCLLGRHLSKSTSELTRSKVEPTRKTEDSPPSFFASLKERWVRSREKIGKATKKEVADTDYAADNSASEQSASVTPLTQSPRKHPLNTVSGSPKIVKAFDNKVILTGDVTAYDDALMRRESSLRKYSFFQLRVHLINGKDLISCDKNGTSDPYVKFKVGGRLLFKSKTIYKDLNPVWDETATLPIEDPLIPINIKVFDYDWGLQDDFMGSALLDLRELDLGKLTDLHLALKDPAKPDAYLGEIHLSATLWPKSQEEKEQYFQRNAKLADVNKRLKSQIWSSVVTIILVEGKDLIKPSEDSNCDQYVKFRLSQEKYKSKVSNKPSNPQWFEQFDFHLYDDQSQELELTVWKSKLMMIDDFIGRCVIDLTGLEREKTHRIKKELEEGQGEIFILLTISGTTASETISDLTSYDDTYEKVVLVERYSFWKSSQNLKDIGHLTVKVYKAQGLTSADIGGKSDPFCVLELVNARLQTHTEYKTLCPSWQKIFTFSVKDINSVLEVTVYDEDRDHKVEFLGKVAIPLLRIRNNEKHWYTLKDKKLYGRAKGNNPQVLLELSVIWNPVRACIRTLNPKEDKYMKSEIKFKRQVFLRNVMRLKVIILWFIDLSKFINDCFEWESTSQSIAAFIAFVLLCYYFEPYMAPVALLLVFLKFYIVKAVSGVWSYSDEDVESLADDDDEEEDKDKEEKKSLKERLQTIQEVTQSVQNAIGYLASLGESVKNTFNFTVPFLSYLAIFLLAVATVVLYFIPVRYLILAWGVNKFSRKLVRPLSVPNNEVLDLLSRVPNDDDLVCYRELKINNPPETERRRDQRKTKKTN